MLKPKTVVVNPRKTKNSFIVNGGENKIYVLILDGSKKQNLQVELKGKGAEAQILGIIVGRGNNSIMLNTLQRHLAPNTTSSLLVKGVFYGSSRFQYKGLIQISKNAQNSNAFQQENNLSLSDQADIDTRPELEIEANEVRCSHAATIGQIDKKQIYYLRTKGITAKEAEKLIIKGFLVDVLKRIADKSVKNRVENRIEKLLS